MKLFTHDQFNDKLTPQQEEIYFDKIVFVLPLECRRLIDSNTAENIQKKPELIIYHKVN